MGALFTGTSLWPGNRQLAIFGTAYPLLTWLSVAPGSEGEVSRWQPLQPELQSMIGILSPRSGVFPPESLTSLNRAYAAALKGLPDNAAPTSRLDLAVQIMRLALDGEGDEQRLSSRALAAVLTRDGSDLDLAAYSGRSTME